MLETGEREAAQKSIELQGGFWGWGRPQLGFFVGCRLMLSLLLGKMKQSQLFPFSRSVVTLRLVHL